MAIWRRHQSTTTVRKSVLCRTSRPGATRLGTDINMSSAQNFIILFTEKEGTSALIQTLRNFDEVSILGPHLEPFDRPECGGMPPTTLEQCLDHVFDDTSLDLKSLNELYLETARSALAPFDKRKAVGFKMRYFPKEFPLSPTRMREFQQLAQGKYASQPFHKAMLRVLKKNDVMVFFAFRRNLLNWALSKYHGRGNGWPGHLQFSMAKGEKRKKDLTKIRVNCQRLERLVSRCEAIHTRKLKLMLIFRNHGITSHPLVYEEFISNKVQYFENMFEQIGVDVTTDSLLETLDTDIEIQKVHSEDISQFVKNHHEVLDQFGERIAPMPPG